LIEGSAEWSTMAQSSFTRYQGQGTSLLPNGPYLRRRTTGVL
jgi:hypothetical protein